VFLSSLRWFVAKISGQRTGVIFRDKDAFDILTLEDDTDTLSRNVGKNRYAPTTTRKSENLGRFAVKLLR
jgi:hypothetical protein